MKSLFSGRREMNRRAADPQSGYYVDVYSSRLFAVLVLIVVFSLLDAVCTYTYVTTGTGRELNPIMEVLLDQGASAFFPYKFVLTALGVIVLCLHKNFSLVRSMISLIFFLYVLVTLYHVSILYAF